METNLLCIKFSLEKRHLPLVFVQLLFQVGFLIAECCLCGGKVELQSLQLFLEGTQGGFQPCLCVCDETWTNKCVSQNPPLETVCADTETHFGDNSVG